MSIILCFLGSLHLSSFEYFFYHFFNLPIRVQIQSVNNGMSNGNNNPSDTIYPILLEDYLAHLLPIDPLQQSKLFSQNIHSHQVWSQSYQTFFFVKQRFFPVFLLLSLAILKL
jgi:hypothetical protein